MAAFPAILIATAVAFLTPQDNGPTGARRDSTLIPPITIPETSGEKTLDKDWKIIVSGDGTECKTVTIENTGEEPAIIKCEWGDGTSTGNITLLPGESHPFICNVAEIKGHCKQGAGEGEETTTVEWTIE